MALDPEKKRARQQRYFRRNRARIMAKRAKRREAICLYLSIYFQDNKAYRREYQRAYMREYRRARRAEQDALVESLLSTVKKPSWYAEALRMEEIG